MTMLRIFLVVHLATTLLAAPLMAGGQAGRPASGPSLPVAGEAALEHVVPGPREGFVVKDACRVFETDVLRLAGGDGADFVVSGAAGNYSVTIGSGGVDYLMYPGWGSVAFTTPFGCVSMFPAAQGGQGSPAGGSVFVTAEAAIFSVADGAVEIDTGQGRHVMSGGRNLVLTDALGTDSAAGSAGAAPAHAEPGPVSSKLAIGFGVVSILTATGVAGVLGSQGDDDGAEEVSPH